MLQSAAAQCPGPARGEAVRLLVRAPNFANLLNLMNVHGFSQVVLRRSFALKHWLALRRKLHAASRFLSVRRKRLGRAGRCSSVRSPRPVLSRGHRWGAGVSGSRISQGQEFATPDFVTPDFASSRRRTSRAQEFAMPDFATFRAGQGRQTARHRSSRNFFAKQSFQAQSLQDMVQLVFKRSDFTIRSFSITFKRSSFFKSSTFKRPDFLDWLSFKCVQEI